VSCEWSVTGEDALAGFFGFFDFNKHGKGVDVSEPPKPPFVRFWTVYWRKFTRMIGLNLLGFVFFLPIIALLIIVFNSWLVEMLTALHEAEGGEGTLVFGVLQDLLMLAAYTLPPFMSGLLLIAAIVFYGPAMCGMAYILRNYAREEHAWFSDFFVHMKRNFRQAAIMGALELTVLAIMYFNITIQQPAEGTDSMLEATLPFVKVGSIFVIILVLFARKYLYTMIVTFDLGFRGLIKNSFAFAFIGLWRNMGVLIVEVLLILVLVSIPIADIIILPFFILSFTGFLSMFATYPLIHKYMVLPVQEEQDKSDEVEDPEEDE
jgi:uncharacterized membrane protein YesL